MALKVIGAGFGRTGTSSLKEALEVLGFNKCYHMSEMMKNRHADHWDRKARGEDVDWEEIFEGYEATLDWPSTAFYKDLADYYPDARVILTVRDPDKWYQSVLNTIYSVGRNMPAWIPGVRKVEEMIDRVVWTGTFGGNFENKDSTIRIFEEHNTAVQQEISAERLLIYRVSEGWEPLCKFLGVPVPDGVEFPRVNTGNSFGVIKLVMNFLRVLPWILLTLGLVVLLRLLLF